VVVTQYLGDKSALARMHLEPVAAKIVPLIDRGLVSICDATEYELLYSAKNLADREAIKSEFIASFPWVPMGDSSWRVALDLQGELTARGTHRCASLPDLLICVVADREGLTILHYDNDFETIAEVTGQPTEWVVPPGTV
jgi:predicted nucleic acid-binding protein